MKTFGFNAPNQYGFNSVQGLGFSQVGSTVLAEILYSVNDIFSYTQDGSGNMVIDNQGSGSTTYDGLLNTGRAIELGATNDLPIPTHVDGYITYHNLDTDTITQEATDGTDKVFNDVTMNNILTHDTAFDPASLTALKDNPNLLAKLGVSTGVHSISELNVALTASDAYYACSEKDNYYGVERPSNIIYDTRGYTESSEILTNGDLSSSAGWTLSGGAIISGGEFSFTGVEYISQIPTTGTIGYEPNIVEITVSELTSGYLDVYLTSGTSYRAQITETGVHRFIIYGDTDAQRLYINSSVGSAVGTVTNVSLKKITSDYSEIANYASTARTNADQLTVGLQTTCLTLDGAGVPTAYREDALEFHSLGYVDTQFNPSLEIAFWIEEVIDGVIYQHHYDGTNLTTYTNNVAGTPTAHSPENASYLLGKGVYPKVTADPETTYYQEYFGVIT